ncbi:ImmA/IrrE family metallo-endopeptidase [Leucobacter sp. BZR 635]
MTQCTQFQIGDTLFNPAFDPLERLAELNVRVVRRPLKDHDALWFPNHRVVVMDGNLSPARLRAVLTHEYIHVAYNDPEGHHPRNEARANLISATILIDPDQWAALTPIYADYDHICLELGITREQFVAYYQHNLRKAA